MDTKSKIPPQKTVVRVDIQHLDELGYGPQGKYTRREWREICLKFFLGDKESFKAWQDGWLSAEILIDASADFGYRIKAKYISDEKIIVANSHRCTLDFTGQIFSKEVFAYYFEFLHFTKFTYAIFQDSLGLSEAQFESAINFENTIFKESANFIKVEFSKNASFSEAAFSGYTSFDEAQFVEYAGFDNVIFDGAAVFNGSLFKGYGGFDEVVFNDHAGFENVNFETGVSFRKAKFVRDSYLANAKINQFADFSESIFSSGVDFKNVVFNCDADFFKAKFLSQCYMVNAVFKEDANFENAIFSNVGHFEGAKFVNLIPSFLGVETSSTHLEFSDGDYFAKQDKTENAIKRLSLLKRLSDEHGQYDQALNFNALELSAKAGLLDASVFYKLITWLYGAISKYGRSFAIPLNCYFVLLLCTYALALSHAAYHPPKDCKNESWQLFSDLLRKETLCAGGVPDDKIHLTGYRAAAEFTLYRAAGVLDFSDNGKATDAVARRLFGQPIEPWWMRIWGVFKAIASTALLFLAALGLRNKYRIK